jgi:hypothetical protein
MNTGHGSSPDGCAGSLSECEHNRPLEDDNLPGEDYASQPPAGTYNPVPDLAWLLAAAQRIRDSGRTEAVAIRADVLMQALNLPDLASVAEAETSIRKALANVVPGYPPGTPVIVNKYESYPAVVTALPSVVAGHRVLAWAEQTRRDGEHPGGVVLAMHNPVDERIEYVVRGAYTKDGGQTWAAESNGRYTRDYKVAWADFTERAQVRPATGS